ncbi:FUSC family protein [Achromobacter aloeverae]|uniref:FUSC family protein n=1 Tax=Achromobacter aloeverae TaxID=1750518 RepID=A0A4Q1HLJ6_9BURK|nr:FUSC family protein [Achromobacter aloeverae]RXN91321.1 FUSC family protein [Achromobacter aloeverae]
MKAPTGDELLFSLKAYVAAMAALYLSLMIDLPRPFWSVTTAYIVSQNWAGAVRSKAVFRLGGTFIGSTAMVFVVPRLSAYPVLMVGALALWIGACLYIAVLDRTPRSYMFMLAGYTAGMIALPSVTNAGTVFDTALARVEEISLGIMCATLVHSLILPRGIAPVVMGRLDAAVRDARLWVQAVLRGDTQARTARDRRAIANDITQLRLLSTHVPYDTGNIRWTARSIAAMQDRMAGLTPIVSSLDDRLRALRADGAPLPADLEPLLDDIAAWTEAGRTSGDDANRATAAALRHRIKEAMPTVDAASDWNTMLIVSLCTRLRELVDHFEEGLALRRDIQAGLNGAPPPMPRMPVTSNRALHHDHGIALLSALAAAFALAICCAFWIGTAWTYGANAALFAVIFSCFFATQDNPVPGIMEFLIYITLSIPLSAIYLLGILPALHSFEMVALAIFPTAFVLGIFVARPTTFGKAMAMLFGWTGTLALHDTNTADLVSFIDSTIAQNIGVAAAAIIAALFRKISAEYSARRIQEANWKELASMAGAEGPPARASFTVRMLDRIGLLHTRLAERAKDGEQVEEDTLLDLRIGNEIAELQRARRELPVADAAIRPVLDGLAACFRARAAGTAERREGVLQGIDHALERVNGATPGVPRHRAIVALVGLRRSLFPQAPAYRPVLAAAPSATPNVPSAS